MKKLILLLIILSALMTYNCKKSNNNQATNTSNQTNQTNQPWQAISTGLPAGFNAAEIRGDSLNLFVIDKSNDKLCISNNKGQSWVQINLPATTMINPPFNDIEMSGNNVWISYATKVYYSYNLGLNWVLANSGLPINSFGAGPFFIKGSTIFINAYPNGIYTSINNGGSWSPSNTGLPNNLVVFGFSDIGQNIFLSTDLGIYKNVFQGNQSGNWVKIMNLPNGPVNSIATSYAFSGSSFTSSLYAGTNQNGLYLSSDLGNTWSIINSNLTSPPNGIIQLPTSITLQNSNIYVIAGGRIYKTENSGTTWSDDNLGLPINYGANSIKIINNIMYLASSTGVYKKTL